MERFDSDETFLICNCGISFQYEEPRGKVGTAFRLFAFVCDDIEQDIYAQEACFVPFGRNLVLAGMVYDKEHHDAEHQGDEQKSEPGYEAWVQHKVSKCGFHFLVV